MGTYCELYVAGYPVLPSKSKVEPIVMTMFRERDKVVETRLLRERNPIEWSHANWDPDETETVVEYRATVADVKSRLRVMGFTLASVERDFASNKEAYLAEMGSAQEDFPDLYTDTIALLSATTFADFLTAFRDIVATKTHPVYVVEQVPTASVLVRYMMADHEDEFHWRFPCSDFRCFIRALLEVVPDSEFVTQELTDLVDGKYYDIDEPITELALRELKGTYSVNSPVIVLTEGPTDSECIQAAMRLLHPELIGYYAFMDLAVRSPGGAGSLVHVVKSFSGAGIENRTIALFDNDTAGHSAMSILRTVRLPETIRAVHYPDIEIARSYPTVGPTGSSLQDVNGSACSVELYFGRDVLTQSGSFIPIQWRGYDDRMKRYQGEIGSKDSLKAAFQSRITFAQRNPSALDTQDWGDMRKLLDSIVDAFNG